MVINKWFNNININNSFVFANLSKYSLFIIKIIYWYVINNLYYCHCIIISISLQSDFVLSKVIHIFIQQRHI